MTDIQIAFLWGLVAAFFFLGCILFAYSWHLRRQMRRKHPWSRSVTDPLPPTAAHRIVTRNAASNPADRTVIRRARNSKRRNVQG